MSIAALFEHDLKLVTELTLLLSREQISLINADIDAMEQILDEKNDLLQVISKSAQTRYHALAKAGYPSNENGMGAWVEDSGALTYSKLWRDFQAALEQAKELNSLNGQLVNKHFNRNQQFLQQLKGEVDSQNIYGSNGKATSYGTTRPPLLA